MPHGLVGSQGPHVRVRCKPKQSVFCICSQITSLVYLEVLGRLPFPALRAATQRLLLGQPRIMVSTKIPAGFHVASVAFKLASVCCRGREPEM